MAVNNPRKRIVLFRLSQEEYERLREASSGSRSLSEFARAKLMDSLGSNPLDAQLNELSSRVERLANLLERA